MTEIYGNAKQVIKDVQAPDPLADRMRDLRRESRYRTIALIVALGSLLVGIFFCVEAAQAEPPAENTVKMLIFDFKKQHPDFGLTHGVRVSGNVAPGLGLRPRWTGQGHQIISEYRDLVGHAISPTIYQLISPCTDTNDIAGIEGPASTGEAIYFDQWFKWVPGVNTAKVRHLEMTVQPDDGFGHAANDLSFHPDTPNDESFTMRLPLLFQYEECTGQSLAIESNGDVWIYVNSYLVIDHQQRGTITAQSVDFDRLNLVDGAHCSLDIFYASRGTDSRFGFKVYNTELIQPMPVVHPAATCD